MGSRYSNSHVIMTLVCVCVFLFAVRPVLCEDCNDNGVPDDQDITSGTSADCNSNGIPDECEVYIENSKVTAFDVAAGDNFGVFQRCYRGEDIPADPDCSN